MTKPTARTAAQTLQTLAAVPIVPADMAAACNAAAAVLNELAALVASGEYPGTAHDLTKQLLNAGGLYVPTVDAHAARTLAAEKGYTLAHGGNPAGYYFHRIGFAPEAPQTFPGIVEAWAAIVESGATA